MPFIEISYIRTDIFFMDIHPSYILFFYVSSAAISVKRQAAGLLIEFGQGFFGSVISFS